MTAARSGRLVTSALDPVLVAAGFQSGQDGEGGDARGGCVQVVYCAGHDEFSVRYPLLPQAHQQEPGGTCVDLVVEVRDDGTLGRLDLEETSVEETLRHAWLISDGRAVGTLHGRSITEALPVIADALQHVFDERPG